jgi:flagellar biosynthesis/type III secretory pathway chaperone
MSQPEDIVHDLKQHSAVCQELLAIVEREGQALRQPDKPDLPGFHQLRKNLLPRLNQSLDSLRKHRVHWQKLGMDERARYPEIGMLLRQNQDLIMKIILIDRENEQSLLRHGLVPPRELPPAARQRPHYVADLYRRRGAS